MAYQDFLPTSWIGNRSRQRHPLATLRQEVDSLLDDFGNGFFMGSSEVSIRSNISETDKEFRVTAELPGLTEADVDVSVTGDRIVIKGEKKSEKEEKSDEEGREFHRIERSSGAFQRMMTLPFQIDRGAVEAIVKDRVLTVKIPKPPESVESTKRIEVKQAK